MQFSDDRCGDKVLDIISIGELQQLRVELRVYNDRATQMGVSLLYEGSRRRVLPVGCILDAEDDVFRTFILFSTRFSASFAA